MSGDEPISFIASILLRLKHLLCGLSGHDRLLHFDQGRMFLRCASCGHETPGWEVGIDAKPRPAIRAKKRPAPRLVGPRRIA